MAAASHDYQGKILSYSFREGLCRLVMSVVFHSSSYVSVHRSHANLYTLEVHSGAKHPPVNEAHAQNEVLCRLWYDDHGETSIVWILCPEKASVQIPVDSQEVSPSSEGSQLTGVRKVAKVEQGCAAGGLAQGVQQVVQCGCTAHDTHVSNQTCARSTKAHVSTKTGSCCCLLLPACLCPLITALD